MGHCLLERSTNWDSKAGLLISLHFLHSSKVQTHHQGPEIPGSPKPTQAQRELSGGRVLILSLLGVLLGSSGQGAGKGPRQGLRTLLMLNWPSKRQPAPLFSGIFMELSMWPTSCLPISSWMSSPTTAGGKDSSHPPPHRTGTSLLLQKPQLALHEHNAQVTQGYTESQPAEENVAAWLRGSSIQNSPHPKVTASLPLPEASDEGGRARRKQGLEQPRMQGSG